MCFKNRLCSSVNSSAPQTPELVRHFPLPAVSAQGWVCFAWERGTEEPVPAAYVEQGAACMDSSPQPLNPNPKSQIPERSPEQGRALAVTRCLEKSWPRNPSLVISKGNSSGLLRGLENAAPFTPSCRMKGILPNKWQELFPGCALTGLRLLKAGFDHSYPKNRLGSHGRELTHPEVRDPCEGGLHKSVLQKDLRSDVTESQRDKEEQRS